MAILENGYRKTFSSYFVKLSKKIEKTVEGAADTRHRQMHTDWPSAIAYYRLGNLAGSEI